MKVILATSNPGKALEARALFEGSPVSIRTLTEAGILGGALEDGTTLEENARIKALFAHERTRGMWVMADDTGLFVNALGGEPGVYTARWAGKGASDEEVMRHCLARMEGLTDRAATFRTVVVLIAPNGEEYLFRGALEGRMLCEMRTPRRPHMPYGALFVPEGHRVPLTDMRIEDENKISHRGQAFRQARAFLESQ